VKRNDRAGRVFCEHLAFAWHVALSAARDASEAEDVVQDAYLNFVRSYAGFDRSRPARPYLARIVTNAAADRARAEARRAEHHAALPREKGAEMHDPEMQKEQAEALHAALRRLEPGLRLAVALRYLHGLSLEETAEVLALPRATASDRVHQGLDQLRTLLAAAGFGALAPAAIAALPMPAVPAGLETALSNLAGESLGYATGAGSLAGAAKGGLIVKIGLGVVAAGLVAGTTFWAVGGQTGEPAKSPPAAAPEKKSAFDTPIWHPDAEWESTGRFLGSVMPANGAGWLDGPKQEMVCRERHPGPWGSPYGSHERCVWACMDEKTERYHVVAGAEVYGYLDGPFSRARHGGWGYMDRAFSLMTPDRRYLYTADMHNGRMIRRLDFMKQEIATVQWEVENFTGLTMGQDGKIYAVTPPHLAVLSQDGKLERKIELEMKGDVGWEASMAHDPKRNRMWATSGHNPKRQWHVWYWDLKDGSFHGEVPAKAKEPGDHMFGGAPGSYKDGWFVYPQSHVYFGPDDPDHRFLYMSHTDCGNSHRLDLEKKEVWVLSGPPRNKSGPIRYVFKREEVNPFEPHVGPYWRPNGDFTMPTGGSAGLGIVLYKRVK
jgi:RNA polymerase sigma-70 factor (ECF subfamily)